MGFSLFVVVGFGLYGGGNEGLFVVAGVFLAAGIAHTQQQHNSDNSAS